ncbi:hypothetical protein BC826DRAFT_1174720 [Russula brevipes]|nr:hypothetical protein BC826DRAFT_1174720 [Russula brevipes]
MSNSTDTNDVTSKPMPTKTFVAALVINGAIAGVEIAVFTLVRRYFPFIYEPRSSSVFGAKRQPSLSPRLWGWLTSTYNADYHKIKDINGMDCYLFVRFLRMMVRVMLPIWLLSWAVLLPLTSVHTTVDEHTSLDKLSFGNVAVNDQARFAGHLLLAWISTIWVWWNIRYEMAHYVKVRHQYLVSHAHASTAQACTILVTGIPPKFLSEFALTRLFNHLPGGVREVWINRDLGDIPELYNRRLKACSTLESTATSLLNTAIKRDNKKKKKGGTTGGYTDDKSEGDPEVAHQTYPPANAAFILFNQQVAAHMAAQTLIHHEPYRMSASQRYIEVAPEDVIWDNLVMNPYERRIRSALSWAATIALILFMAIPVSFIGIISSIRAVCTTYHWLEWVCKIPPVILNVIQGFAPVLLLVILNMLIPIIMRMLARFEGIPQKTAVELSLMDRFFLYQVFNGFLVVALSSGIIKALPFLVNDPNGIPRKLAENLPGSSTFFLNFILLQGLSGAAGGFLQVGPLVMYYVKLTLLASTPRSVYESKYSPRTTEWGTVFPTMTQLVVITFGYSIIAPVINGLAFAAFFLFYLLYKYLFTWVNNQPRSSESGGLFFPKAIQHLFVGLYIQQLCLCALFFLTRNGDNKLSALPEGGLMIVLIVFTAFFQDTIRSSYGPLIKALPLSLADSAYSGAAPEVPATTDEPKLTSSHSEDVEVIEYANVPARASRRAFRKDKDFPPLPDDADVVPVSSPSLPAKPIPSSGPTDFRHPATAEEQRVIWLPKDQLGLVHEIGRDLDSHDIFTLRRMLRWTTRVM